MYSVYPEPEPAERAALERALAELLRQDGLPTPYRSDWRRLALEEGAADEGEEDRAF